MPGGTLLKLQDSHLIIEFSEGRFRVFVLGIRNAEFAVIENSVFVAPAAPFLVEWLFVTPKSLLFCTFKHEIGPSPGVVVFLVS